MLVLSGLTELATGALTGWPYALAINDADKARKRDAVAILAEYAAWLGAQPLSARTREAYLAAAAGITKPALAKAPTVRPTAKGPLRIRS